MLTKTVFMNFIFELLISITEKLSFFILSTLGELLVSIKYFSTLKELIICNSFILTVNVCQKNVSFLVSTTLLSFKKEGLIRFNLQNHKVCVKTTKTIILNAGKLIVKMHKK